MLTPYSCYNNSFLFLVTGRTRIALEELLDSPANKVPPPSLLPTHEAHLDDSRLLHIEMVHDCLLLFPALRAY